jgi:glyoxylase-like metal-dependent hydrolase (beta-lactamase superfamily II)
MTPLRWFLLSSLALLLAGIGWLVTVGVPATSRTSDGPAPGAATTMDAMERVLDAPGPIAVETVIGAHWSVDRSGLIDLSDPRAASLDDGLEPIEIFFHALRHPTRGLFLIDTGVERALFDDPSHAAVGEVVASLAGLDRMERVIDTASWLAHEGVTPEAVLLTHLHFDHVSGMPDVPSAVPVWLDARELAARGAMELVTEGSTDRALGTRPIATWHFEGAHGVIDVLGDQSLFAISVPGHTDGSVAYVARTPSGPVLFTGDACHTRWGWDHDVAPGEFTADHAANAEALALLRALAARHPSMQVRLGHQ